MHGGYHRRPFRPNGVRCTRRRFHLMVRAACDDLPVHWQKQLQNIAVTVEDRPTEDHSGRNGPLGLYQGTPVGQRGTDYSMAMPDKVTIYRVPLLISCHSQQELREEVRLTVLHEIGHHFGMEDHELPF